MSNVKEQLAQLTPDKRALLLQKVRAQQRTDETNRGKVNEAPKLPLRPVSRAQPLPLSFAQERLWILQQLQGASITYNAPVAWRFTGRLHKNAFEQALYEILQRHESLRTTVGLVANKPVQIIQAREAVTLDQVDLQSLSTSEQTAKLQALLQQEMTRPFALQDECPIRMTLFMLGPEEHLFLVNLHHIVIDAWSLQRFEQELSQLYAAFMQHKPSPLPPLAIQYADFALWQRQWLQGDVLAEKLAYWQTHLTASNGAPPPPLELPTDFPRPAVQSFAGAIYRFILPPTLQAQLQQVSQQQGATLFMTLYAAFSVLMARYSDQHEIIVGTTMANRMRQESTPLIGFFTNMLALRTDLSANPTFLALLEQVRQTVLDAYQHQDLPFEKVVEAVRPERSLSHEPLVQVVFDLQSTAPRQLALTGLTITQLPLDLPVSKYDLGVSIIQTPTGLGGEVEYSTALFDAATIERMMGHFRVLLEAICADPTQPVWQLPLLTPAEAHQLLVEWNATQVPWSSGHCVQQLVEAQATQRPEATAVVFAEQSLTYGELNRRANQLAHHLQTMGGGGPLGVETIVGICLERSLDLVVSILAVLKAGGAYLPMDPSYPPERLRFMLDDARSAVLLTQQALAARFTAAEQGLQGATTRLLCVDSEWSTIAHAPTTNPAHSSTLDTLAYTIYTSGSTGQPKGVLVPHRGLCNLVAWHQRTFAITAADRATCLAGLGFDAAVWEIWPYLTVGATLHLSEPATLGSAEQLRDWLVAQQITVTFLPTPLAEQVLPLAWPSKTALRLLLTGGDRLRTYPADDLPFALINNYGPTENSVVTTSGIVVNQGRPTPAIGRPIDNVQLYILDRALQPTPIGVPGELHIGGQSLACGYLNRPELTAEKFITNPFGAGKLYKTGDLVRYLPHGEIEFLGRIDNQVKLRGFRIELGEIESGLLGYSGVQAAAAVAWEDKLRGKRLVAYLVSDSPIDSSQLRHYLAQSLPEYMLPSAFVQLSALPLTPNGKLNRSALPRPAQDTLPADEHYVAPGTPTERTLARIWADILGLAQVGMHDNFFEIGGDSILSIQIVGRAKQQGIQLVTKDIFQYQTIRELASVARVGTQNQAEQGVVTGELPLTPIQRWFLVQEWREPHHFNQALLFEVASTTNPTWLESALIAILHHHDALRLRFQYNEQQWRQVNQGIVEAVALEFVDLSTRSGPARQQQLEQIANCTQTSLNLGEGPLLRAVLFTFGKQEVGRLLLVIHHMAVDGVSWRILLEDLQTAYEQCSQGKTIKLPAKTTAFRDWARWLADQGLQQVQAERNWWLQVMDAAANATQIDLPTDFAQQGEFDDTKNTFASVDHVTRTLSIADTDALLHQAPAAYHTQVNDLLLTALAQTMSEWLGTRAVMLELEGHGRELSELAENSAVAIDLSRTVGWFTSIFPVILQLDQHEIGALIKSIKEQLRQIPNRGIGYGILRYMGQMTQLVPAKPIAVSFNYLGQFVGGTYKAGQPNASGATSWLLNFADESSGQAQSTQGKRTHLIDITGQIMDGQLQLSWHYSRNFHTSATITALAENYMTHLRILIEHCLNPAAGGFTPSDFSALTIDQTALDQLVADIALGLEE